VQFVGRLQCRKFDRQKGEECENAWDSKQMAFPVLEIDSLPGAIPPRFSRRDRQAREGSCFIELVLFGALVDSGGGRRKRNASQFSLRALLLGQLTMGRIWGFLTSVNSVSVEPAHVLPAGAQDWIVLAE
jgi:hypothetical protein